MLVKKATGNYITNHSDEKSFSDITLVYAKHLKRLRVCSTAPSTLLFTDENGISQ